MPPTLLDRSGPFGTVCGVGAAWSYEQDGKRFDAQGWEIVEAAPLGERGQCGGGHLKVKRPSRGE